MTLEILNKDWSIWQILSGDFWLNAITLQNPARLQDGFFSKSGNFKKNNNFIALISSVLLDSKGVCFNEFL